MEPVFLVSLWLRYKGTGQERSDVIMYAATTSVYV